MDLFEYTKQTDGLENSLNFAIKHGLVPDRKPKTCFRCERQGGLRWTKNSRILSLPYMFVCANRECRLTIKLSRNTLFDKDHVPLPNALRLIYFWLLKLCPKECSDQLQLSEKTVVEWYQFFREICAFVIINYTQAIGGQGHIIELSEYCLQTQEESYDVWMVTGIDRSTGQNFAIHVEELDNDTLWPIIKNYILPGSLVLTPRHKEFTKKEQKSENLSIVFVHPSKKPRAKNVYNLDNMWNALVDYIEKEIPHNTAVSCKELYAYQFLYFNRDGFCNKPASELILPFLSDVKQVYPGFEKDRHLKFKWSK